jgi:hypothetical protein
MTPLAELIEWISPLLAQGLDIGQIAKKIGKSRSRVGAVVRQAGLAPSRSRPRSPPWSDEERRFLERNYGKRSATKLAAEFRPPRTKNSVVGQAYRSGLSVSGNNEPRLTDDDFVGCRYIAGEPVPLHPGMFCCRPLASKPDASGQYVKTSWCSDHLAVVETRHPRSTV